MQNARSSSSSDIPESPASVTPTADSGLVGFNSPVLPLSDASQAEIERLLHQAPKKSRFAKKKAPKPAAAVFAQPPISDAAPSPEAAEPIVPYTGADGMMQSEIDVRSIALDDDDEFDDSESLDFSEEYEDVDFALLEIDPSKPTKAKPGSEEKVLLLAARRAAGMPLWHSDDTTDHGPTRKSDELRAIADASLKNPNAK